MTSGSPTRISRVGVSPARKATALVAGVGCVNGLAAIRSLGRIGVPVIALNHGSAALGFRSRFARPRVCPDPVTEEEDYVRFLIELGDELDGPAPIFPTGDDHLETIARHADKLNGRFLYPFPPWTILEKIQSKQYQLDRAGELGVPTPRTSVSPTDEFGFPTLVKPTDPVGFRRSFGRQAFRCRNMEELEAAFERSRPYGPLVQEFIPGEDRNLYQVGAYLDDAGEALAIFCCRKLRQIESSPGVGSTRIAVTAWEDEAVRQSLALLSGLGCRGLAEVEFKRDPRDGLFKLMEVNPRLWQWHGLASSCGVDFPQIAYGHLLQASVPPIRLSGEERRWAITFLTASGHERRSSASEVGWAGWKARMPAVPRPPYVDAIFALDDPMPSLLQVARLLARPVWRTLKLARRLVRGRPDAGTGRAA